MSDRPTPETDILITDWMQGVTKDLPNFVEIARQLEQERDEAREAFVIATDQMVIAQGKVREANKERDEARAVADGLASVAAHCLGRHDHECPDAAIKIAAALKRWKKSQ